VFKQWISIRDKPQKKTIQVRTNIRVGILLDKQRGRRVAQMKGNQSILKTAFGDPALDFVGKIIKAASARSDSQFMK
jgi:hypothetical protein